MTTEENASAAKQPKRRLTKIQWAQAEALWASGSATLRDLADKFEISEQAINKHMTNAGIVGGAKAEKTKVKFENRLAKQAAEDAALLAARVRETKDEHYKMAAGIAKLAWSEVLQAKQKGLPMSAIASNLKALDIAATTLAKARIERWACVGLDRDDTLGDDGLPELTISELTAEEIQELRERDFNEFEELDSAAGEVVAEG